MVQNDIHRLHVLLLGAGKIKDALWFSLESLCAIVQGCSRKLLMTKQILRLGIFNHDMTKFTDSFLFYKSFKNQ